MNKDLNLKQAIQLLDYLKNSSGGDKEQSSNVEILSGLILLFCRMYLDITIAKMIAENNK